MEKLTNGNVKDFIRDTADINGIPKLLKLKLSFIQSLF